MNALIALVQDSDRRVSVRVHGWHPPRWARWLTIGATRFGDGWGWAAVAAALASRGGATRVLAEGFLAAAIASAAFSVLKRRFRRPRPCDAGLACAFGVAAPDQFSFPSGHSMNAFAIAAVLGLHVPLVAPALGACAALVAASRVALGLHYVSDVLAGGALGLVIGASVTALLG